MKKKFFAVALATTMVVSTIVPVSAATSDVTIDGGFSANTGYETLSGDFDVTYTFHNKSNGTFNWDNFIVEIRTADNVGKDKEGKEVPVYIDARSDNFGWLANQTDTTEGLTWAELSADHTWDTYAADMQAGMDCTVNIVREGNKFTINMNEGDKYSFTATTTAKDFEGQDALVCLTGEKCALTNVTLVDNAKTGIGSATSDVTIGTVFSANTGDEIVSGDFDVTYTFNNKSNGTNNWDNFIVEIRTANNVGKDKDGKEVPVYIDARSDNFGWLANQTDTAEALIWAELPADHTWDTYAADMQAGMDCIVNIVRKGNDFTIKMTEGEKYTFVATVTAKDFEGQDAVFHLTGEKCALTNVKLVDNTISGQPQEPEKPSDPTTSEDPTKPVTSEGSTTAAAATGSNKTEASATDATKGPEKVTIGDKEVTAAVSGDNVPQGAKMTVAEVTDKEELEKVEKAIESKFAKAIKKYVVLDLNMMVGTDKVQPLNNGKVLVTVDVPSTLDASKAIGVYRMENDGTLTELKATVKDGKVSFETDHFSTYVIAEKAAVEAESSTTAPKDSPKTGDVAPVALLMVVALGACATVVVSKRREVK